MPHLQLHLQVKQVACLTKNGIFSEAPFDIKSKDTPIFIIFKMHLKGAEFFRPDQKSGLLYAINTFATTP